MTVSSHSSPFFLFSGIRHLQLVEQQAIRYDQNLESHVIAPASQSVSYKLSQPEGKQSSYRADDSWDKREGLLLHPAPAPIDCWHHSHHTLPQSLLNVTGDPLSFVLCGCWTIVILIQCHLQTSDRKTGHVTNIRHRLLLKTRRRVISQALCFVSAF